MPTGIPYCDEVLEVTGGCTKCSPGCQRCWAIKEVWRSAHNPLRGDKWQSLVEKKNGELNWMGKIKYFEDALDIPLRRKKPTTYFVNSKADLFHRDVPFWYIDLVFAMMTLCPQHTFLIFTKRIDRALDYILQEPRGHIDHAITDGLAHFVGRGKKYAGKGLTKHLRNKSQLWPLDNTQLTLSISTQKEADEKIPTLLQIPAAVRGLSIEPMLEEIDIKKYLWVRQKCVGEKGCGFTGASYEFDNPNNKSASRCPQCGKNHTYLVTDSIDGVIVGGESGPGARLCPIKNIRNVVNQCKAANVPVFVKQIHLWDPMRKGKSNYLVKDINQFPEDLRIQQLPEGK